MILRIFLSFVMAIGLAGFGIYGWRGMHQQLATPPRAEAMVVRPPPPVLINVLVASHDLRAGTLLHPEDLGTSALPIGTIALDAKRDTPAMRNVLSGALISHSLAHGLPITDADVLLPGDHGFLSTMLDPGMRAFTIERDQIVADAGLIWPGDHLDLILTEQAETAASAGRRISAETILPDVPVLAIDQQLTKGESFHDKPAPISAVTVEVSPAGVERLAVALRLGKLALSVRPAKAPGSNDDPAPAGSLSEVTPPQTTTIWAGDVMRSLNGTTDGRGAAETVHVFSGHDDGKEFRF